MGTTSPDLVRQAITARISALVVDATCLTSGPLGVASTVTGYAQSTTDTWQEAEEPLVPELEPSTRAHLSFFVDDRDVDDTMRSRSTHGDEPLVRAPLIVRFLYRVRPMSNRKPDWDRASRAGRALLAHLLHDHAWTVDLVLQRPNSGQLIRRVPIAGDGDGNFLAVEVRVDAIYQLSLAA